MSSGLSGWWIISASGHITPSGLRSHKWYLQHPLTLPSCVIRTVRLVNYSRIRTYNHHPDFGPISDTYYVFILPYSLVAHPDLQFPFRTIIVSPIRIFLISHTDWHSSIRTSTFPSGFVLSHPDLYFPIRTSTFPSGLVLSHQDWYFTIRTDTKPSGIVLIRENVLIYSMQNLYAAILNPYISIIPSGLWFPIRNWGFPSGFPIRSILHQELHSPSGILLSHQEFCIPHQELCIPHPDSTK